MKFIIARFLLAVITLSGASAASAGPDGKTLYQTQCAGCHQTEGRGGIGLPLTPEVLANVSDDYISQTIRVGRPGRIMPSFEDLSDAQVSAIVDYVRKRSGKPAMQFDTANIQGDAKLGKVLYGQHCVACHSENGSGKGLGTGVTLSRKRSFLVMPAAISNPGFLASAPDAMIKHTVLNGRNGTAMPSFKDQLSDQQINDIVAHVRSFARPDVVAPTAHDAEVIEPSYVVESPYDLPTTVKRIKEVLKGYNFRSFPDRFLDQGLTEGMTPYKDEVALRFCNFNELYKLLRLEPRLGAVLPCRITVVKHGDKVLIIAANMRFIASRFNNDQLDDWAEEMDAAFQEILDEVTL